MIAAFVARAQLRYGQRMPGGQRMGTLTRLLRCVWMEHQI